MTAAPSTTALRSSAFALLARVLHWLDRVPYTLLAIPLRLAVATVFWDSAMAHLANWQTTLELFETEYALPFLPSHPSAYLAVTIELSTPPLLVVGLLTRPAAAVLLGMTAVIEVFVYPLAWPTHIQWAAMLLVLLCRGPGKLSVDWLIGRRLLAPTDRFAARERSPASLTNREEPMNPDITQTDPLSGLRRGEGARSTGKAGLVAAGGILGALAASSCCMLPVALFMLGISGVWIGNLTALAPYQPIFFIATAGFLGTGYYLVYRQPRVACADGTCKRPLPTRIVRGVLWAATVLALAAVGFDYLAPVLLGA